MLKLIDLHQFSVCWICAFKVMLYSEGFQHAKEVGHKLTEVYSLSTQLLSPQKHYDWGTSSVPHSFCCRCRFRWTYQSHLPCSLRFEGIENHPGPRGPTCAAPQAQRGHCWLGTRWVPMQFQMLFLLLFLARPWLFHFLLTCCFQNAS